MDYIEYTVYTKSLLLVTNQLNSFYQVKYFQNVRLCDRPVRHADVFLAVGAGVVFDDGPLLLAVTRTLGAVEVTGLGFFLQVLEAVLDSDTCKLLSMIKHINFRKRFRGPLRHISGAHMLVILAFLLPHALVNH